MRVWISDSGEPLPFQPGERLLRYGELSRYLAANGHQVTWWATDFAHRAKTYIGKAGTSIDWNGVDIRLVHGSGYRRNVGIGRLVHIAVHARNLQKAIVALEPPDIIVSGMPTTEASEVLVNYGQKHDVPVVVDIRDEWPEDYVRWLPRPLRPLGRLVLRPKFNQLERVCSGASAIFGVTEQQLNYGLSHGHRTKASSDAVIYTGARAPLLDGQRASKLADEWRARGVDAGKFVCVYAGTMSPSRPLGPVIDAAIRLSAQIPIMLVIAGNGDAERDCRRRADGHPAIHFVGWVGQEPMNVLLELADVLVAPYDPRFSFSMPTKMFDYMAAGKPIVSSCPGEARALIEAFGIGLNYTFDDSASVQQALAELYANPARRRAMGLAARRLFDDQFSLDSIVQIYTKRLQTIVALHAARRSEKQTLNSTFPG